MMCHASPCKAAALLVQADVDVDRLRSLLEDYRYHDGRAGRDAGRAEEIAREIVDTIDYCGLLDVLVQIESGYSE